MKNKKFLKIIISTLMFSAIYLTTSKIYATTSDIEISPVEPLVTETSSNIGFNAFWTDDSQFVSNSYEQVQNIADKPILKNIYLDKEIPNSETILLDVEVDFEELHNNYDKINIIASENMVDWAKLDLVSNSIEDIQESNIFKIVVNKNTINDYDDLYVGLNVEGNSNDNENIQSEWSNPLYIDIKTLKDEGYLTKNHIIHNDIVKEPDETPLKNVDSLKNILLVSAVLILSVVLLFIQFLKNTQNDISYKQKKAHKKKIYKI